MRVFLFVFCFHVCSGWWQMGHMLVNKIAYDNLVYANQKKVDLLNMPEYWGVSPDFVQSAIWPDELKSYGLYAFNAWHYKNKPFVPDNTVPPPADPTNLVWAIEEMVSTFRSPKAGFDTKSFALRMLGHLVGDSVQPMHAITLFSQQFPEGDRGGNLFRVTTSFGSKTNLHSFFDSGAYRLNATLSVPLTVVQTQLIQQTATEIMQKYPLSSFPESALELNYTMWEDDSYNLGLKYAYLDGNLQYESKLTKEYEANAYEMCLKQIAVGGYRLVRLIEKHIDGAETPIVAKQSDPTLMIVLLTLLGFVVGIFAGSLFWCLYHRRKKFLKYRTKMQQNETSNDILFE